MSLHVLRELNDRMHVVWIDTDSSDPIVRRRWYPTDVRRHVATQNLGSDWEGTVLRSLGDGRYEIPPATHTYSGRGLIIELVERGRTLSSKTDQIEVPPPKTRRRGRIFWQHGEWWISGPRGEEILSRVNLHDYVMA